MRALAVLLLALSLAVPLAAGQDAGNETAANDTGGSTPDLPDEPAAPAGPITITLTGNGAGGAFFFALDGQTGRNPTLTVAPGQEVTVILKTVSGAVHNFCTDASGEKKCTPLVSEGDEASVTFTAPETPGSFEYWCDPHRSSGMKGRLTVGTAPVPTQGGGSGTGEEFNGETVDLGDLGYSDCAGTKIPAVSADQAVGGPTVNDYVEKCRAGGNPVVQSQQAHPADYIIPGSFALIALGVVGVVWAHRRYKP